QFMLALLDSPDIYLDEIQEELQTQHDIDVPLSTIWRTLTCLGISSKALSKSAAEHCAETCHNFIYEIGGEAPDCIICINESAVNILMIYQQRGWAYKHVHAQQHCCFVQGTQYVVM
ncbi:hypothetical protein BKA93DRAFT_724678, partial [Sparassis latifolia]